MTAVAAAAPAPEAPPARLLKPVKPLDARGLAPGAVGERPELMFVRPQDLRVDPAYQREIGILGQKLIRRMVETWDWTLCAPLTVAPLEDGLWELIDGQHRATAALTHGRIPMLPAYIVRVAGREGAARAFSALNSARVAVTTGQRHRAAVAAGDAQALAIEEAVRAAGARLVSEGQSSLGYRAGDTMALGALDRALAQHGRAATVEALRLGVAAGLAPIRAPQILALAETLALLDGPERDRAAPRLVRALQDWDAVADRADLDRLDKGLSRTAALSAELHRRIA